MRKLLILAISISVVVISFAQEEYHKHGKEVKQTEVVQKLEGEVLDLACFITHEEGKGEGKKHKKCASKCILGGVPMGLLTKDRDVYLILEDHDKKAPYEQLKKMAAEKVIVTGKVIKKGGVQTIIVDNVEMK